MTTNQVRGYVRTPGTGAGVNAITVSAKIHNGGTTVTTDATDANGLFEIDHDTLGYPGPLYLTATSGGTTDIISGNDVFQLSGLYYPGDVPDVFSTHGIGVVAGYGSELWPSASGASMNISITGGMAILKDGIPYIKEGTSTKTISASDPSNPRIDRIVLRLVREGQTEQGKVTIEVITGTPAVSPTAPALTQTSATWDFSLCQVLVGAGVTTIAADKVTTEHYSAALGQSYCFLYPSGRTAGDMFYIGTDGKLTRLAAGSTSQYISIVGGVPTWTTMGTGSTVAAAGNHTHTNYYTYTLGPWGASNFPISNTEDGYLWFLNSTTTFNAVQRSARVDQAAEIVGAIMCSSATVSGGTCTLKVNVSGVSTTFNSGNCVLNSTNQSRVSSFVAPGSGISVTANQVIYPEFVTNGSWSPTTNDVSAWLVLRIASP